MTAVNVMLQKKQAFVMTDTLAYSPTDGIPHSFHRKALAVSEQRTVVSSRGDVRLTKAFSQAFAEVYDHIDDAIEDDFDVLKEIYEIHLAAVEDPARQEVCDIIFVGWSQAENEPIGRYIVRREAWETHVIDPAEGLHAPGLADQDMEDFIDQLDVEALDWSIEAFDPLRHGIVLMEAQRRVKFQMPGLDLPPMNLIGGQIQLTTLTERGVVQETLHDWHDRLGVLVHPKPYVRKPAAAPAGMNRQQRRAWEKKHGKVAA